MGPLDALKALIGGLGCVFVGFLVALLLNYATGFQLGSLGLFGIALILGAIIIFASRLPALGEKFRKILEIAFFVLGLIFIILFIFVFMLNFCILSPCGEFKKPPVSIMIEGLKEMNARGFGVTSPDKVTFDSGMTIYRGELVTSIPIKANEAGFFCSGPICGNEIEVSNNERMSVMKKRDAWVVVCGNEQRPITPRYCIAVSDKPADATNTCVSACGIE